MEETIRVIFVGMHNKPDKLPLCSSTKTGKLINRIIKELPTNIQIVKTNLLDIEHYPTTSQQICDLSMEWYWTNLIVNTDIVILLGAKVHEWFKHDVENLIKIAHPASKRSHIEMDKYVIDVSKKIIEKINKINKKD